MARNRRKAEPPVQVQDLNATIVPGLHSLVVPIGTLNLDEENVRKHDERNIESIKESLKKFKQRKPIIVQASNMRVEAGNGTFIAAKRLGWTHIAAIVVDEDDVSAVSYAIADNRTAELAEWDFEGITKIVAKYNLDPIQCALGFSVEEIASIMTTKPWDASNTGDGGSDGGGEDGGGDEGSSQAVTIKVRVVDVPYRARVQTAIKELIEEQFKGLARIV